MTLAAGVSCSPAPKSTVRCLAKYNLKSDAVFFTMVTKIDQSRDPLYIIPTFTGQLLDLGFLLAQLLSVLGKRIFVSVFKFFLQLFSSLWYMRYIKLTISDFECARL